MSDLPIIQIASSDTTVIEVMPPDGTPMIFAFADDPTPTVELIMAGPQGPPGPTGATGDGSDVPDLAIYFENGLL